MKRSYVHFVSTTVALTVVAALGLGCARSDDERPGAATISGATATTPDKAAAQVSQARCERERACNEVGPGRRFADDAACLRELGHDARATLREDECGWGVDASKLSRCVADVKNERCGNPIDAVERIASCRRGELCIARD